MEDMKRLVEKYKRELMEYSKAAPVPEKLNFPEMLPDSPVQPESPGLTGSQSPESTQKNTPTDVSEQAAPQEKITPRIIGYSDDRSAMEQFERIFSGSTGISGSTGLSGSTGISDGSKISENQNSAEYDKLPPQLYGDVPQVDVTNNEVFPENNYITDEREPEQQPQFPLGGEHTDAEPAESDALGVNPESGTSSTEQVGRRSFENQQPAVNSRNDIKPLVQNENPDFPKAPPLLKYQTFDEFLKANPKQGSVQFRTYTARNALPVPGATVVISTQIAGKPYVLYTLTTDISGQTEEVTLPAPDVSLSLTPDSGILPYALYDADVTVDGFRPVEIRKLPVFDGILSVQRAAMVPAADGKSDVIEEAEPELTEVADA